MCGIVGIVDKSLSAGEIVERLRCMTDRIVYRGPDDDGFCTIDGIGVGMRRLSIIDVEGGHQPIASEDGQVYAVCNGEIYNFKELRADLEAMGHQFSTNSDAETIVHLYEEYGENCVEFLRGMFGLAVLDRRNQSILIARDRLGKKPLFYAENQERFYFGSEIKTLLAGDSSLAEPDYRWVGQFLQFAFVHHPNTIYRRIKRFPAGHYAVWKSGRLTVKPYWQLEFQQDESRSEEQWRQRLDALLEESVALRMRSDVPLGVFLSGGLDSSTIAAYAQRACPQPLKTFTVGFDRPEWDETEDAALVARHLGTEHHLLPLNERELCQTFESTLRKIIHHCDEPFGDASAIPTYHISKLAREHVTVILSGDGGDELFAGYSAYQGAQFAQTYRQYLPYAIGRSVLPATAGLLAKVLPENLRYKALRVSKVLKDSALPIIEAYREKTSIWNVSELRQLLDPDLFAASDFMGPQYLPDPLWGILQRKEADLVSRLSEIDIHSYLLDDILVKVDRMSMAHSLEVRSPLLDHHIVELAAALPTRFKIRKWKGKHLLRETAQPLLPKPSMRKGKQGFSVPLRDWFRGEMAELVNDYLGPGGHLPNSMFSQSAVARILNEHRMGVRDHANKLWLLLTFATWHRDYQDSSTNGLTTTEQVACES